MQQNKLLLILLSTLLILLSILISNFYFKSELLENELNNYSKLVNSLNLERDFEIYIALQDNNITRIKKNLNLNFMFHLSAIETDGIKNVLDTQDIDRLCETYSAIKLQFKNEYEKNYPSSVKDLNLFCKLK